MGNTYRVLKLGGSLITCKDIPRCVRLNVLDIISDDIIRFLNENPNVKLILLHGGGSFGHYEASINDNYKISRTSEAMQELNYIIIKRFFAKNLRNVVSIPGKFYLFKIVIDVIDKGLIPLVYGDIRFDGTIISADDMSIDIAKKLKTEVLYAIDKDGIIGKENRVLSEIKSLNDIKLIELNNYDVTGGILSKVSKVLENKLNARVFNGSVAGNIYLALKGYRIGTLIRGDNHA
ncbi:uridylate kinase [Sulfolobus sp. A20]|uniref:isopentenyl phosphate kinase n=1 Tax=Sulfolobaceae TaxID=118883 RepID=UPI000845EF18|nr:MULTISPECIES: isopentenyl phosphate kinase [unclassified Sulfolobus]AOL16255.1 uridylate kinase [Sulfolobus sp. A20]